MSAPKGNTFGKKDNPMRGAISIRCDQELVDRMQSHVDNIKAVDPKMNQNKWLTRLIDRHC